MSKGRMISQARKVGYSPTAGTAPCPKCYESATIALSNANRNQVELIGKTIKQVPWINTNCALIFVHKSKLKPKLYACPCGWRKLSIKKRPKNKVKCVTPLCNAIITKKDRDNRYCAKCRNQVERANIPTCVGYKGKPCGNPLPEGRKARCHDCQPVKTKKEVASNVIM